MHRTKLDLFDPAQILGDMISMTSQVHSTGYDMMMNGWEGGLDFFSNLLKQAEEVTARNSTMLARVGK